MRGLLIALGLLAVAGPALAALPPAPLSRTWNYGLDLRRLPPATRPALVTMAVDARSIADIGLVSTVSIALNGNVIAHARADAQRPVWLQVPLTDRLFSVRNRIEVAAVVEGCRQRGCKEAVAAVKLVAAPVFGLAKPEPAPTDFSQLVTRYKAGFTVEAMNDPDRALAAMAVAALAPRSMRQPRPPGRIVVSKEQPEGFVPPLRFDLGPVRLTRSDGVSLYSPDEVADMTVVQILRAGDRPLIWIRPGRADRLPTRLDLDHGDVALFDGRETETRGRVIAFSSLRDRAVRIEYGKGVDVYGEQRSVRIWRWSMFGLWILATIGLIVIYRRLPVVPRREAA